jgi:hypothetical protein
VDGGIRCVSVGDRPQGDGEVLWPVEVDVPWGGLDRAAIWVVSGATRSLAARPSFNGSRNPGRGGARHLRGGADGRDAHVEERGLDEGFGSTRPYRSDNGGFHLGRGHAGSDVVPLYVGFLFAVSLSGTAALFSIGPFPGADSYSLGQIESVAGEGPAILTFVAVRYGQAC